MPARRPHTLHTALRCAQLVATCARPRTAPRAYEAAWRVASITQRVTPNTAPTTTTHQHPRERRTHNSRVRCAATVPACQYARNAQPRTRATPRAPGVRRGHTHTYDSAHACRTKQRISGARRRLQPSNRPPALGNTRAPKAHAHVVKHDTRRRTMASTHNCTMRPSHTRNRCK